LHGVFKLCYGSDNVSYLNQEKSVGESSSGASSRAGGKQRTELIPAFDRVPEMSHDQLRRMINQAVRSWLRKTPSLHTRVNYLRDLRQFLACEGIDVKALDQLVRVHPEQVAAWRDWMRACGYTNATIRRRMTTLRSLFSYLRFTDTWAPIRRTASSSRRRRCLATARRSGCHRRTVGVCWKRRIPPRRRAFVTELYSVFWHSRRAASENWSRCELATSAPIASIASWQSTAKEGRNG
jgi:Phage integrase, N-terminal SAM-like domain